MKSLIVLLLLALILRVYVAFFSLGFRENTDVLRYKDWGRIGYLYGLPATYSPAHLTFGGVMNNMPPGTLYILESAYRIELHVAKVLLKMTHTKPGENLFINGPLVTLFLRLPSILADLGIGWMIYLIVSSSLRAKRSNPNRIAIAITWLRDDGLPLFALCIFLFNPVVIYNSAFWGQMDSVINFSFLLGIWFLLRKRIFWSIFFVALSMFIKFSLVVFLPVYFLELFIIRQMKEAVWSAIMVGILILLMTLPVSHVPVQWWLWFIPRFGDGEVSGITTSAFNFWWLSIHPYMEIIRPSEQILFSHVFYLFDTEKFRLFSVVPLSFIGYILWIVSLVPVWIFRRKLQNPSALFIVIALSALTSFLIFPRMHERYLYPLFPFFAISIGLRGQMIAEYILLSILNFVNLYLVWHPFSLSFLTTSLMGNIYFQEVIAILTVVLSLLIYVRYLRYLSNL